MRCRPPLTRLDDLEVHQPVQAAERHGGFRPVRRQRPEAPACPARHEDEAQYPFPSHRGNSIPSRPVCSSLTSRRRAQNNRRMYSRAVTLPRYPVTSCPFISLEVCDDAHQARALVFRLEKDGAVVVIDPGGWSDAPEALITGAAAILVTHEHPDHLDADAVRAALSADPDVTLWANQSICAQFAEFGDRVHEVGHGDALGVGRLLGQRLRRGPRAHPPRHPHRGQHRVPDRRRAVPPPATRSPSPETRSTPSWCRCAPRGKRRSSTTSAPSVPPAVTPSTTPSSTTTAWACTAGCWFLAAAPGGATVARVEPGTVLDL